MRAFVVTGPGESRCRRCPRLAGRRRGGRRRRAGRGLRHRRGVLHRRDGLPAPGPRRAIRCGSGTSGAARWPRSGDGVDPAWVGRRVMGDTMLGCGHCRRCRSRAPPRLREPLRGRHPGRIPRRPGRTAGRPGHVAPPLPDTVDAVLGAMVEPGGNALRAARAAALQPGDRVLVLGPGTIGLLVAMFARAEGAEVHLLGRSERSAGLRPDAGLRQRLDRGRPTGPPVRRCHRRLQRAAACPPGRWSWSSPAGRVVYIGLAGTPSLIDTRILALKDVTAVGILSRVRRPRRDASRPTRPARSTPGPWWPPPSVWTRSVDGPGRLAVRAAPDRDPRSTSTPDSAERHDEMDDFNGLVAVVTGGASGIGAATARLLQAEARRSRSSTAASTAPPTS